MTTYIIYRNWKNIPVKRSRLVITTNKQKPDNKQLLKSVILAVAAGTEERLLAIWPWPVLPQLFSVLWWGWRTLHTHRVWMGKEKMASPSDTSTNTSNSQSQGHPAVTYTNSHENGDSLCLFAFSLVGIKSNNLFQNNQHHLNICSMRSPLRKSCIFKQNVFSIWCKKIQYFKITA